MFLCQRFLQLVLLLDVLVPAQTLAFSFNKQNELSHTITICQNKDCCQRWNLSYLKLPETLEDLLPPETSNSIHIETTNCFSLCGQGPNVCIRQRGQEEIHLNGVTGPMSLADELESKMGIVVPSKLVAAVTVMEKAEKAPLGEKDRFYKSIIQVLKGDPALSSSSALSRAHACRAQALFEQGDSNEALDSAREALETAGSHESISAAAWRTSADCYSRLGQIDQAVVALQGWAKAKPSFQTKAQNEIQQLLQVKADSE